MLEQLDRPWDIAGVLPLASRRPGHAAMKQLLRKLDQRGCANQVPPDLKSWYVGALGEIVVGHELARLPNGWHVLHAVPAGAAADIDHLVIGPPGVFVINTKRHPDKRVTVGSHVVWIGGSPAQGYQAHLLSRTVKVAHALEPLLGERDVVRPLLVFVDVAAFDHRGAQSVAAVTVGGLIEYLHALEPALSPGLVDALFAKASQPMTWAQPLSVAAELDPTGQFLALTPAPTTSPVRSSQARSRQRAAIDRPKTRPATAPRRAPAPVLNRVLARLLAAALAPVAAFVGVGILSAVYHVLLTR